MDNIIDLNSFKNLINIPLDVLDICLMQDDINIIKFALHLFMNPDICTPDAVKKKFEFQDKEFNRILGFWLGKNIFALDNNKIVYILDNKKYSDNNESAKTDNIAKTAVKSAEKTMSDEDKTEQTKAAAQYKQIKYTTRELSERARSDKNISALLSECESIKGGVLTRSDMEAVMYMVDTLGFDAELVLLIATYCSSSLNKTNMRYILSVATSWHKSGVRTYDEGEGYLKQIERTASYESKVKKIFGLDRTLTDGEKKYIRKWAIEYKSSFELIKKAYEIMIERIAKIKFPYIDKILETWHIKNYKTVRDINEFQNKKKVSTKKTDDTSYNLDEFMELAWKAQNKK